MGRREVVVGSYLGLTTCSLSDLSSGRAYIVVRLRLVYSHAECSPWRTVSTEI